MKMKLRKCSCGGTAEIVGGEPTELGAKMLREYGLTPSRTYFGTTCGWVDLFEEDAKKLLEGE